MGTGRQGDGAMVVTRQQAMGASLLIGVCREDPFFYGDQFKNSLIL